MSFSKKGDVVAIVGKYQGAGGQEKNSYLKVGVYLEDGEKKAVKLNCIPVDESGRICAWLNIYPIKERDSQQSQGQRQTPPPGGEAETEFDEDIPF